jgi:hypothetical protein
VLKVLARTRESIPFAVAFLAGPDGEVDQVASYGLTADVPHALIDGF